MDSQLLITEFTSYFRKSLKQLEGLRDEPALIVLKKLAFVATIDALAKVGAHEESSSRKRFVTFLGEFSGWSDRERVSLPHLVEALTRETEPAFDQIRSRAQRLLAAWPKGAPGPHYISCDPLPEELLSDWPTEKEGYKKVLGKLQPERFSHRHLLYSYRNFLAHELREGGWPTIERGTRVPYYSHTRIAGGNPREKWLLHYPLGFLSDLAIRCLEGMEKWEGRGSCNPYDYYRLGDYFLEELS